MCKDQVDALTKCHEDHPIAKFWGKCNQQKAAMDRCFKIEKEAKRKVNAAAARESRKRYEENRRRLNGDGDE